MRMFLDIATLLLLDFFFLYPIRFFGTPPKREGQTSTSLPNFKFQNSLLVSFWYSFCFFIAAFFVYWKKKDAYLSISLHFPCVSCHFEWTRDIKSTLLLKLIYLIVGQNKYWMPQWFWCITYLHFYFSELCFFCNRFWSWPSPT